MRASLHYADGRHEILHVDQLRGAFLILPGIITAERGWSGPVRFQLITWEGWAYVYQEVPQ